MNTFRTGQLIKERRRQKGWTQNDLAERLHVTDRAVSKWERGINAPDLSLLEPLAQALEVTTTALITGECASNALTASEQEAMTKDILRRAEDMIQRNSRGFFRRMIMVILFVGLATAVCRLWLWWPHAFDTSLDAGDAFRIEFQPAGSAAGERQIYTFSADDPTAEAIRACFRRYTWHYDFVLSFLYSNSINEYYDHLLTPELDGDVLVLCSLKEDGTMGDTAITLGADADWFFLNGNMAVLTGPRGDQNGSGLIARLKTCMDLQA